MNKKIDNCYCLKIFSVYNLLISFIFSNLLANFSKHILLKNKNRKKHIQQIIQNHENLFQQFENFSSIMKKDLINKCNLEISKY